MSINPFDRNSHKMFFRDHNACVNFKTGDMSIGANKQRLWKRPVLDMEKNCYQFKKMLQQKIFQLCIDPEDVMRHFFEVLGYLMNPSEVLKYTIVFYGDQTSGKHEILNMVHSIMDPTYKHTVKTDHKPANRVHTDQQIDYTLVIPFFGDFSKHNSYGVYHLDVIINNELEGITATAMHSLRRLIKRGNFNIPTDCQAAYEDYFRTTDHIGNFIKQCCVVIDDDRIKTPQHDIWTAYQKWSNEHSQIHVTKKELREDLISRGFNYIRTRKFEKIALIKLVS